MSNPTIIMGSRTRTNSKTLVEGNDQIGIVIEKLALLESDIKEVKRNTNHMTRQLDQFGQKFEEIDENLAEMDKELMIIKQRMEWMERETKKLNAVITGIREE